MIYGHSISGSGDSSTACSEQNSLADTHGNGYVADKLRMMMNKIVNVWLSSCGSVAEWLGCWTCDQQVTGLNPSLPAVKCNPLAS